MATTVPCFARSADGECFHPAAEPDDGGGEARIAASVGTGGRNAPTDVRAIQTALNDVDPARGGPTPPLKVDGLCGPLTRAAIGRYQRGRVTPADGRVDPGGPTLRALNGGGDSPLDLAGPIGAPRARRTSGKQPPNPLAVMAVTTLLAEVRMAVGRADFHCTMAAPFCPSTRTKALDESVPRGARDSMAKLQDTFSLLDLPDPQAGLDNIRRVYRNMAVALNRGFGPDPRVAQILFVANEWVKMESRAAAYTTRGGAFMADDATFTELPGTPANRIYICNNLIGGNAAQKINTAIHELAHYVSGQPILIVDVVRRAHMLTPGDRPKFDRIAPADKLRSAEHYAFFACTAAGIALPPTPPTPRPARH
ncbi:peptidoglycan-binding domain-containing protein [Sphingomonas sp.]|uniref:peptidoglycan-binding domain-containing protein n=1 Tax=Sphingomonas sp. TaxID=28214 RepID=UPI003B00B7C9